jgi:hypothetical protein
MKNMLMVTGLTEISMLTDTTSGNVGSIGVRTDALVDNPSFIFTDIF